MHYCKDPLGKLGFGVLSYLNLIKAMMALFLCLSIIHLPLMSKYSSWDPLPDTGLMQYTVGNLGQSTTQCAQRILGRGNLSLSCHTGKITNITHFGIFMNNYKDKEQCSNDDSEDNVCRHFSTKTNNFYTHNLKPCIG